MKTDEAETKRNSLHGETEKSFFWNGKSLALTVECCYLVRINPGTCGKQSDSKEGRMASFASWNPLNQALCSLADNDLCFRHRSWSAWCYLASGDMTQESSHLHWCAVPCAFWFVMFFVAVNDCCFAPFATIQPRPASYEPAKPQLDEVISRPVPTSVSTVHSPRNSSHTPYENLNDMFNASW